ncbi:hypothetical protein DdX_18508 [Ditylenchus destructor]|uniref:Uncharacterized protein n=1 Tax=Ditylenchus destructor TaxID=166010 RepID=A0AAD4MPD8_9BILA|nr:hypothetical protein DdX_18508 [Ditylenchus destructor]
MMIPRESLFLDGPSFVFTAVCCFFLLISADRISIAWPDRVEGYFGFSTDERCGKAVSGRQRALFGSSGCVPFCFSIGTELQRGAKRALS